MAIKDLFPLTYEDLSVFRPQMYHDSVLQNTKILGNFNNNEGERFVSCRGRIFCLLRLLGAPFRPIIFIAVQIVKIAALVFMVIVNLLTCDRDALVKKVIHLTDVAIRLVISPLCDTVECIRNLFGLIHPGAVFADNPLVIVNPNPQPLKVME